MKKIKLFYYVAVIALLWGGSASVLAADYYVKTDGSGTGAGGWGNAMGSAAFSQALINANPGDVFYVAAGTYYPSLDEDGNTPASEELKTFVLKPGVKVIGSYLPTGLTGTANDESDRNWNDGGTSALTVPTTVFDGQNNKEHVWTVLPGDGVTSVTSVLDGIQVTGGRKLAESNAGGSGIYATLNKTDRLEILNCRIDNNYTASNITSGDNKGSVYAAGLYVAGIDARDMGSSFLKIYNTIIANNTTTETSPRNAGNIFGGGGPWGINMFGAGAFVSRVANAEVDQVDIFGNNATGFGPWGGTGTGAYNATLAGTLYMKTYVLGSGMVFYNSGNADFSNLRVYQNEAHGSVAGSAGLGIGANDNFPQKGGSSPGVSQHYTITNSTFNNNWIEGRFAGMGAGFGIATDGKGEAGRTENNTAIVEIDNVTSSGNIIDINAVQNVPLVGLSPQDFSAGGGFYTGGAQVAISNSTFSKNKSKYGAVNSKKSSEFTQYLPSEQRTGLFYAPDNSDVTLDNVLITDNIEYYRDTEGNIIGGTAVDESLNLTSSYFGILANKENKAEIKYSIIGSKYFGNPGALTSTVAADINAYVTSATTLPRYINTDNGQISALAQNDGAHTQTHALANPCTPALYWGNPAYAGETSQNGINRSSVVTIGAWDAASKTDEPEPPVAANDYAKTGLGAMVTVSILNNDTYDCDPEVSIITGPTNGTATLTAGNTIEYTPDAGFIGGDELTYNLNTPFGNSQAKVYITVSGAQVDITVFLQGPTSNGSMPNNIQMAPLYGYPKLRLPVTSPYGAPAASCPNIDNVAEVGAIVDWVKVEVRDAANPKTVLETRALLLKTDGHIVDIEGNIPTFIYQPNAVYLTVNHRSHLAVASNSIAGGLDGLVTYDFSTDLSKAYNPLTTTPMVQVTGSVSVWCMWAGDLNSDEFINSQDLVEQRGSMGVFDEYIAPDITLDGFVNTMDETMTLTNSTKFLMSPILFLDM